MKKLIAMMLVLLCALSLIACQKTEEQDSVEEPVAEETIAPVAE